MLEDNSLRVILIFMDFSFIIYGIVRNVSAQQKARLNSKQTSNPIQN